MTQLRPAIAISGVTLKSKVKKKKGLGNSPLEEENHGNMLADR